MLIAWMGMGLALVFSGLSLRFEIMERLVPVLTYALVPVSGSFFMVGWLPSEIRDYYLLIPIPHGIEMVRAGVFGEFVKTYYDPVYAFSWGAILNFIGLILLSDAKARIDVE